MGSNIPTGGEQEEPQQREPMTGSRTPIREHALIQPRITEFLNGEPTDRPTLGNQVAGPEQNP